MAAQRADRNVRVNKLLTNLSVERAQGMNRAADKIYPYQPQDEWTGEYYEFTQKQFKAPGLPKVRRGDTAKATPMPEFDAELKTFACQDEALEVSTPVKRIQQMDKIFDLRNTNVARTENTMLLVEEKAVFDVVSASGTYPTGHYKAGHASTNDSTHFIYFDGTNGDAKKTIRNWLYAIYKATGLRPNTIIFAPDVVEQMTFDPKITGTIQYVAMAMTDKGLLSKITGIPESGIHVPDFQLDAAAVGKPEDIDFLWKNCIWAGYVAPSFGQKIQTFGATFSEKMGGSGVGFQVREYYEESEGRGTYHDIVERSVDRKTICKACGGFLSNVYTSGL